MNIITNEKPQIGGAGTGIGFKDVRGDLDQFVGSQVNRLETGTAYAQGAVGEVGRRIGEAKTGAQQIVTVLTPEIIEKGTAKLMNSSLVKSLPKYPLTDIIKPASKYNTFYKIIFLILFFIVFLKVIINIFKFFGIDIIDLYSYLGWFIFLMIILIFIPHDYSTLKLN